MDTVILTYFLSFYKILSTVRVIKIQQAIITIADINNIIFPHKFIIKTLTKMKEKI